MRCREFPDEGSARAGCGEGEVVVYVQRSDGSLQWGVVPAFVAIDQGDGRDPVRQPVGEFLASWWDMVGSLAGEEQECTEV